MNFLAHAYLSGSNEKILSGNFFGDFVKGNKLKSFEIDIQRGILLHREIDQFTDQHAIVLKSKKRLRKKYRHYAPVIADVFYDHFLANNWSFYHKISLSDYTAALYDILEKYVPLFSERAQKMFFYMKYDNWLLQYREIEGIDQALTGMSRRTTFDSQMESSVNELRQYYGEFEQDFHSFFPDIMDHCNQFRAHQMIEK